ncbi:BhlA/UviB family holin-like peptide [Brevibacillus laterosporus]|uniref:BhlA/UviB family holin-like peptide n=1 Tax=Brevibacillus laterosporus TaxID=1465 RepID=UPI002654E4D9|nr:BhlA/UviB family holin-like peptide [Brevibacillus laterosporus]MDN9012895.1 BhlA/UviB family holin-like peptide [Brevibacillus laterosporus]MDO0944001.1 BhlA/UviB family holin-like peptide [Brevibacillus laterosporus]
MEEPLFNALLSQGPFAGLFVWLLFSTKKEGRDREAKLMEHNERMVIQLERNTTTLQQIERSLAELGSDVQELKEKVG